MHPRITSLLLALLLTVFIALGDTTRAAVPAQNDQRCFPETGQCIAGRFRRYWEQNGGLPVFGYPITPARDERNADTGRTYLTQWFERNRFELHADTAAPYDVQLGRLGDDRLRQQGRDWRAFPRGRQTAGCLWFAETGRSVCEPFKSYWETHGLLDPALDTYARSLALFGLPLSERGMETNTSGDLVETQWFERARFECHPNNKPEYRVLLGLLGGEVRRNPAIPGAKPAVTCTVTAPSPPPASATLDTEEAAFLLLINDYRRRNGLQALTLDARLTAASEWLSQDMAGKNYFSHTDSHGRDPFQRMAAFGYTANTAKAENIAAGHLSAAAVFAGWQASPGHNTNMLNGSYRVIGIGRAHSAGSTYGWYWTTDFGGQ